MDRPVTYEVKLWLDRSQSKGKQFTVFQEEMLALKNLSRASPGIFVAFTDIDAKVHIFKTELIEQIEIVERKPV